MKDKMKDVFIILIVFLLILIIGVSAFYRAPKIQRYEYSDNVLYSPAYGKVEKIISDPDKTLVSIFLRLSDIHSQYYPTNGVLKYRVQVPGKYRMATKYDKTTYNAKVRTVIQNTYGNVQVDQISGKLARKITTDMLPIGSRVQVGKYLGRIHLGSRVNLTFPSQYRVQVKEGEYVKGPDTIIAKI